MVTIVARSSQLAPHPSFLRTLCLAVRMSRLSVVAMVDALRLVIGRGKVRGAAEMTVINWCAVYQPAPFRTNLSCESKFALLICHPCDTTLNVDIRAGYGKQHTTYADSFCRGSGNWSNLEDINEDRFTGSPRFTGARVPFSLISTVVKPSHLFKDDRTYHSLRHPFQHLSQRVVP